MKKIIPVLILFLCIILAALSIAFPWVEQEVAGRNDSPLKWVYGSLLMADYPGSGSTATYDSVAVVGESFNDSTMYYWMYPVTAISFMVASAADSINFKIYAETCNIAYRATAAVPVTRVDSLIVTTTGRKTWRVAPNHFDENIRFRFVGQKNNGIDKTVLTNMRINRSWDASTITAFDRVYSLSDTSTMAAPGNSKAVSVKNCNEITWFFKIGSINTNVAIILQLKSGFGEWTSVETSSLTYTANGNYGLTYSHIAAADSARFRWISEAGGTDALITQFAALSGGN